jgi:hypothetical protein
MFFEQLLQAQIPNAQKKSYKTAVSFGAFGICERKNCA